MNFRKHRSTDADVFLRSSLVKNPAKEILISSDPHGQLHSLLSNYKISAIMDAIALVTACREQNNDKFEEILRRNDFDPRTRFMPSLLRRLLTFAIAELAIDDNGEDECPLTVLAGAESLMFEIDSEDSLPRGSGIEMARRARQSQTRQQLDPAYFHMDLIPKLDAVTRSEESGIDVDGSFRNKFGLSYRDLVFFCFSFYAMATANPAGDCTQKH